MNTISSHATILHFCRIAWKYSILVSNFYQLNYLRSVNGYQVHVVRFYYSQ